MTAFLFPPGRSMAHRFARLLLAAGALIALLGPARAADADRRVIHVLNRLAFGPTVDDFNYVKAIGVERYIAEQLDPAAIDEPIALRFALAQLDTRGLDAVALRQLYGPLRTVDGVRPTSAEIRARQVRAQRVVRQAEAARVLEAVLSRRQLQQVMVNFWFNHFNVFAGDGLDRVWVGDYEEQAIRPYALGRFRDLLFAVAKHPAMLIYLDNTQNVARGLNENYAREVMELHTLGVDGGYTQNDVTTLARVFTGWRVNPPNSAEFPGVAAVFEGSRHDYGPKVFLGRRLVAQGRAEGEEALEMLAESPATAHHISYELAQYFVADAPPPALVERLAARFLATGGDIRAVLASLFASPEFWDSAGQKYKTPYEYVISAVRAAGVPVNNVRPLLGWMSRLGMPLYGCQTPDGYQDTEEAWLSPEATMQRINFAVALARGFLPLGAEPEPAAAETGREPRRPDPVDPARLDRIFGATLSGSTSAVVAAAPPVLRAALILGSPDFMHR
ncbi:MAG TPA: DUF1800 domain-containing protein [Stellaceae bacterium]|jgi:hypothetical protein|nr:DUF1800 domain-containing protein [Stellaceae bacterium]